MGRTAYKNLGEELNALQGKAVQAQVRNAKQNLSKIFKSNPHLWVTCFENVRALGNCPNDGTIPHPNLPKKVHHRFPSFF